jgi:hypothetical protein
MLCALLLTGCANSETYLATPPDYRRVGVISVVGSEFTYRHIGTTAFTNGERTVPVPQWGLDQFITQTIEADLRSRYSFVPTEFDAEAFRGFGDVGFSAFTALQHVEEAVRDHARPKGLDAYLVVIKKESGDQITNSNQTFVGLGLLDRNLFGSRTDALYASFEIYIVDGHANRVVSHVQGAPYEKTIITRVAHLPFRIVDAGFWSDQPNGPRPEQEERIKRSVQDLLAEGINGGLVTLGLR